MKEYRYIVSFSGTEIVVIEADTLEEANKKLRDGDWDDQWEDTYHTDIDDSSLLEVKDL